ncbi:ImmA/IrrE family metallo-endopeptidase [Kribbella sp. DT2]|uniref:ImmA/IrrE family metallo-endopeptidase n=1 Tax=Kribbella sp. DT2 TaxID=3393427 RepID=UPI003CF6D2FB
MNVGDSGDKERSTSALGVLHDMLGEEIRKLRTADDWKRWLRTAAAFHEYSFRNAVLIAAQRPGATLLGERAAWRYLGRRVVGDENAMRIFAQVFSRATKSVNAAGTVTRRVDHDLAADSETPKVRPGRRLVGFRVAHVFDVSQTDGEPLPKPSAGPVVGRPSARLWEGLATCVEGEGYELLVEPIERQGVDAYTDSERRRIVVSDSLYEERAVTSLAHQVAHMLLHEPDAVAASGSVMCRGMREVEAESVVFVLLTHHGLEADGWTFPYVAGWAASVDSEESERVVQRTGERVLRLARELIDLTSPRTAPEDRMTPTRHLSLVPEPLPPAPDGPVW